MKPLRAFYPYFTRYLPLLKVTFQKNYHFYENLLYHSFKYLSIIRFGFSTCFLSGLLDGVDDEEMLGVAEDAVGGATDSALLWPERFAGLSILMPSGGCMGSGIKSAELSAGGVGGI